MRQVPAWAQVAAAMLFVGVAAGVANLHVTYGQDGLTVRTGWYQTAPAVAAAPAVDPANAPWHNDLAALEQQIRSELDARPVPTAAPARVTKRRRAASTRCFRTARDASSASSRCGSPS